MSFESRPSTINNRLDGRVTFDDAGMIEGKVQMTKYLVISFDDFVFLMIW